MFTIPALLKLSIIRTYVLSIRAHNSTGIWFVKENGSVPPEETGGGDSRERGSD
jgi:hypothetical protein